MTDTPMFDQTARVVEVSEAPEVTFEDWGYLAHETERRSVARELADVLRAEQAAIGGEPR